MMKAYLVTLTGMGDTIQKLVDEETFNYICDGGPLPASQVTAILAEAIERNPALTGTTDLAQLPKADYDYHVPYISETSSSQDNDRAIGVHATPFNGETFDEYEHATKALIAFVKKHDLDLQEDEYEGYIY